MPAAPSFLLALCQPGAERALVAEAARHGFARAYSRPGFVTLKRDVDGSVPDLVFARFVGASLGKLPAPASAAPGGGVRVIGAAVARDGADPLAAAAAVAAGEARFREGDPRDGDRVVTVVEAAPGEVWAALHVHGPGVSPFPGALLPESLLPAEAPSRAWLKLEEAARTFRIPFSPGEHALEIGSAPGGAAWNLLSRGLDVVGIDPNAMDERVLAHPGFTHLRRTSTSVDPAALPPFHWLLLDVNVPPGTALRGALPFVAAAADRLHGVVLTLKLKDFALAEEVPGWLRRIARAAPRLALRARQLSSNGQEICVVGLRR